MIRALVLFVLGVSPALAASYTIDPGHSRVGFSITHMMVSTVRGEFGTFSGTIEYDAANVGATKIDGKVGLASINTRDTKRDDHLKSPDFFDVSKYTEATFKSKSVKNITDKTFDVVGDMTIRGVTKEVTFTVGKLPEARKDPWGNMKSGTRATATINRKDFGMVWNKDLDGGGYIVGDDVAIEIDLEVAKK